MQYVSQKPKAEKFVHNENMITTYFTNQTRLPLSLPL